MIAAFTPTPKVSTWRREIVWDVVARAHVAPQATDDRELGRDHGAEDQDAADAVLGEQGEPGGVQRRAAPVALVVLGALEIGGLIAPDEQGRVRSADSDEHVVEPHVVRRRPQELAALGRSLVGVLDRVHLVEVLFRRGDDEDQAAGGDRRQAAQLLARADEQVAEAEQQPDEAAAGEARDDSQQRHGHDARQQPARESSQPLEAGERERQRRAAGEREIVLVAEEAARSVSSVTDRVDSLVAHQREPEPQQAAQVAQVRADPGEAERDRDVAEHHPRGEVDVEPVARDRERLHAPARRTELAREDRRPGTLLAQQPHHRQDQDHQHLELELRRSRAAAGTRGR